MSQIQPPLQIQSPLVRRLLGGNSAPSDDERTTLTVCRQTSRVRLASMKETIEAMNVQLAVMTEDACKLSQEVEVFDSVLHPVRSLPHEIIHHICQLAMEDLQSPSLEALASPDIIDSLSMRHPSWTCAQVCHRWRHVIWNNPRCWTSLTLTFHKPTTPFKLSLLLINVLERTRGLPLSIAIHSSTSIPFLAMPIILQSCLRWQHATLSLTIKDFRLLSEMKHAFGELRTLQLHIDKLSLNPEEPIDAFSEALGIHSVEAFYDITPCFNLGWHRVQRFVHHGDQHAISVGEAQRILTRTTAIGVAEITLVFNIFGPPASNIIVPSLRTLTLHDHFSETATGTRVSGITSFLRTIELPNLTSLTLDMHTVDPLSDLRGASSSSILDLSLSVRRFGWQDSEALQKFLAYAPSVQHFALHVQGDVDLELVFSSAAHAFAELPIQSLTLTAGGSLTISPVDGITLAVHTFSWLWRKGIFKTLSIRGASLVLSDEVTTALRGLVEEGLELDMSDVNRALWKLDGGEIDA